MPAAMLAYEDTGIGDPLVLLHAFPFDRRFWHSVTPAFVHAGFRVIAPDLRGFGASPAGDAPWTLLDQAHDVAALLDRLAAPQAHVLGLSMGGYVALALVAALPQRVNKLVLAHTKAAPDTPQAKAGRQQGIHIVQTQSVDAFADGMLPKMLSPHTSEETRSKVRALMNQPADNIITALRALRDRPDQQPELSRISAPTLVLTGAEDAISTPMENQTMAAEIPRAQVEVVGGAAHLSNFEAPDVFISAVVSFLGASPAEAV